MRRNLLFTLSISISFMALVACSTSSSEPTTEPGATAPTVDPDSIHTSEYFDGKLSGTVVLRSGVNPPNGSKLVLVITGNSSEVARTEVDIQGPAPWAYSMQLDQATFDADAAYVLTATITDPEGEVWFGIEGMAMAVFRQTEAHGLLEVGMIPMNAAAAGE